MDTNRIYTHVQKIKQQLNLSDDDVQDIMEKILSNKSAFDNIENVEGFVHNLCKNHKVDVYRKEERNKTQPFTYHSYISNEGEEVLNFPFLTSHKSLSPDFDINTSELKNTLLYTLKMLTEEEQLFITEFHINNKRIKVIAEENNRTIEFVRLKLFKARKKMQNNLKIFLD